MSSRANCAQGVVRGIAKVMVRLLLRVLVLLHPVEQEALSSEDQSRRSFQASWRYGTVYERWQRGVQTRAYSGLILIQHYVQNTRVL
jgi:hypothetical protein